MLTVLNPLVQKAIFIPYGGSPDIFIIAKASTQKERLGRFASSLRCSALFLHFTCGVWPSTGRGVVRASHISSTKISSKESRRISAKFCTSEIFPLYGMSWLTPFLLSSLDTLHVCTSLRRCQTAHWCGWKILRLQVIRQLTLDYQEP